MLGWTPDQTITNFKHLDQLFPVRTVPHAASTLELPNDEPIDPIVPLEGRRLTVNQLMDAYRVTASSLFIVAVSSLSVTPTAAQRKTAGSLRRPPSRSPRH
jgi:hypothetical protein